MSKLSKLLDRSREFEQRHIGPRQIEIEKMLEVLGEKCLESFIKRTVPASILDNTAMGVGVGLPEDLAVGKLRSLAEKNQICRSFIGCGYYNTITPAPIKRHVLENPGWYTQYTPYQAEIAQGRLEALLNFQTLCSDLTGLEVSNASLLDEATAAAEAMAMCSGINNKKSDKIYLVDHHCHPQTLGVLKTRAEGLGINLKICELRTYDFSDEIFGAILQYPNTLGSVNGLEVLIEAIKARGGIVTLACDLLSLTKLKSPGELGAEIAVGSSQRFGVPLGFGGPHAAFFSTTEKYKRKIPGRIIGVSKDRLGSPALRLALQTREQHIRREKATSNICTAQALLASMASMYVTYHGPDGLKNIATRVHLLTATLRDAASRMNLHPINKTFFDTLTFKVDETSKNSIIERSKELGLNLRIDLSEYIGVSLDETTTIGDIKDLVYVLTGESTTEEQLVSLDSKDIIEEESLARKTPYLEHEVFNSYHSETLLLRYIKKLESRDLSLTTSMIPLGSCTMKLNAASELCAMSWPEFANIHPFVPVDQARGYLEMIEELADLLSKVTGFSATSLQPNSGAQGEYAGLLVIRKFHESRGDKNRKVCLIPVSAHGTNPASAVMAGMQVVLVNCDADGNIDLEDLCEKAELHSDNLAALMITYPSTHGVFEESIREICQVVHNFGGQVYLDGANLNAQIGLCRPGCYGPDVAHLNLHKTFAIPHGGGGPGMGPIAVAEHLREFLPAHPLVETGGMKGVGNVSAAPFGSALVLTISWMYIKMMGDNGLRNATMTAILNANYVARKLESHYPVLYRGSNGLVAHECIIDLRIIKSSIGIEVEDIAKRLIDFGFHAPTVSFPVAGTMMIEPTESESLEELDRFCEAMICIKDEIDDIGKGVFDRSNNPLTNAPHTAEMACKNDWDYPYSRSRACYPVNWLTDQKFWPSVARVDNAFGDRNLICSCPPLDAYS